MVENLWVPGRILEVNGKQERRACQESQAEDQVRGPSTSHRQGRSFRDS